MVELSGGAQAHSFQGHAAGAGFEEQVQAHFAQEGKVGGGVAAAAALEVFPEDDDKAPFQAILHLPVLPHATGDEFSLGLEAGDEKTPSFGGLAGDGVEGLALAEGNAGEAAPLAPAGEVREVSGDSAAPGFEAAVASFGLF